MEWPLTFVAKHPRFLKESHLLATHLLIFDRLRKLCNYP